MEEPRLLSLRAVAASWHFGIKFIWCRKPAQARPHLRSLIPFVAWVEHYVDAMGQDRTAPDIFEFCLLLLYLASHVKKGESKPKSMPRPDIPSHPDTNNNNEILVVWTWIRARLPRVRSRQGFGTDEVAWTSETEVWFDYEMLGHCLFLSSLART